jgi:dCMP deaminase
MLSFDGALSGPTGNTNISDRPGWDAVFMGTALLMSERSTCPRLHTGACIATSYHQILTTGYNGAVRGLEHCTEIGCLMSQGSCVRAVHAETNAIAQAARLGIKLVGGIIYVTHRPCITCAKNIVQAGLDEVVYGQPYLTDGVSDAVFEIFNRSEVTVRQYGAISA